MSTFGKYEVVTELFSGERGAVFSARAAGGGREIKYAVKTFNPHSLDMDEQFWEGQSFTERARVQQRVAEAGGSHWAPVYEIGSSPAGTYYVTDFHPLTAASLVAGRVEISPGMLYSIVRSVVAGLAELNASAGRAHGNLKASNVLINSRGDVTVAGAVLTDPAPAADAANAGEAGDLYALGGLIHLLVVGRRFEGGGDWPLGPAREWSRLGGRQGRMWRRLCNELLSPDPAERPDGVDAVARRVRRLVPRRAHPSRRLSLAVAAAVVLVAAGAAALLGLRDAGARREVCAAKERWAGGLATALADSKRRALLQSDPDLLRVVHELDRADLAAFECDHTGGRFGFNPDLRKFRQTQDTLDAVRRAERGLSPIQWRQLARAAELQGRFEARGWTGPARHLAECIAGARPGSPDLAAGIERFLVALGAADKGLPAVEEQWVALQTSTRKLDETRDPVMRAFAAFLRSSAASSVALTDAGFGRLEGIRDAADLAEQLSTTHSKLAGQYDEARFKRDVVNNINPTRVQVADIDRYLKGVEAYRVKEPEIRQAVTELRALADAREKAARDSGVDKEPTGERAGEFSRTVNIVRNEIAQFGGQKFIQQDIDDGTFGSKLAQARAVVALLNGFVRMPDVKQWLAEIDKEPLGVASTTLNAAWAQWRDNLPLTLKQVADQPDLILEQQDKTRRLREVLLSIDRAVPAVPRQLSDESLTQAAQWKREDVIGDLLRRQPPAALAREADAAKKVLDSEPVKRAAAAYEEWTRNLTELGKDFPLRARLLTPEVRPDEKWAAAKPEFWKDPRIQTLVAPDLERLERLRAVAGKPREELVKVAAGGSAEEVALQAWRLLGADGVRPPWPTRPGELAEEASLRKRLVELLGKFATADDGRRAARELNDEGPRRWRRFAEAAGADEAMLASAVDLREAFGVGAEQFSALSPEARFNLSLLDARRHFRDTSDDYLTGVVADLRKAASELNDRSAADDVDRRLAKVQEKEPFAGVAVADDFILKPTGTDVQIPFKRVKPEGRRPFYLETAEVSFAQFAAVVGAGNAWDDVRPLVWSPQPGEVGDPRRGPRVWEWVLRPAPQMYPAQLWLFPEDANVFPKELRDPRGGKFNASVLGEAAGGMPSDRHPMQYVPSEAAMYFASLAGCRLPTPAEWKAAYDGYEKPVPAAEWNLRDQAWDVQRRHAAEATGGAPGARGPRLPDEGIYLPPDFKGATGAAARSLPQRDGTLYFRPADGPGGRTFHQLVGNVAEIVCEASESFEQLKDRRPQSIKSFVADAAAGLFVIGGSALSPPEAPVDQPLPIKPGAAFADVGFRLAFTAPAKNLGEKLEWVLAGRGFIAPHAENKTASAVKPPPS